jgi:hypothetical protein
MAFYFIIMSASFLKPMGAGFINKEFRTRFDVGIG